MKKMIAKGIAAAVSPKSEEEATTAKWVLGSVEIPQDKKKEAK